MLADANYALIAIMVLIAVGMAVGIAVLTHLVGPRRSGPVKQDTYESGVTPIGDTRRRFNVRFYLVAVLFLVFDVELFFLLPWGLVFHEVRAADAAANSALAATILQAGYSPLFLVATVAFFVLLLAVGLVYEWRKGIFRWD